MMEPKNVLGSTLLPCGTEPMTGFFRDGCCRTSDADHGTHTVCARVTPEFLAFSLAQGNDLSSAGPGFPGLRPGDRWCLCAARWKEALGAGVAPPLFLAATHELTLAFVTLEQLRPYALEESEDTSTA